MRTQTQAALKREGIVEEKVLPEVKKRVRHAERVLRPALENATQAKDTATQAQKTANSIAKVTLKWCFIEMRRSKKLFVAICTKISMVCVRKWTFSRSHKSNHLCN